MNQYSKALMWAAAMVLLAIGMQLNLVARQPANTVLLILPLLAVLSLCKVQCAGEPG